MVIPFMLIVVTLNVNGLYDPSKWQVLWQEIPHADIICLQETHLTSQQEHAFCLHASAYDFFFEHGASNSGGVLTAVKRNKSIIPTKSISHGRKLLVVDLLFSGVSICVLNIYAPNIAKDCLSFFQQLFPLVTECTMLLSNFNSVTISSDCLSSKLDDTSHFLQTSLMQWNLKEPSGSHRYSFTYHHPAVPD